MTQIISKVCYECSLHPDKCKGKTNIKTCPRMQPDYDTLGVDEPQSDRDPDPRFSVTTRPVTPRPMVASDLANDTTLRNIQHGAGDDVEHVDIVPDITDATEPEPTGSKHDNFVRLRDTRLKTTLHHIKLIGNLSMSGYEYSAGEAESVIATLEIAVREIKRRFKI